MGTVFNSFKKLKEEIKAFEQESFVNLVKRRSRSIQNAIKRGSNKSFNPDIVFAEINFVCKQYGQRKWSVLLSLNSRLLARD